MNSRHHRLSEDEIVANLLKIMIDNGNDCTSHFLRSQEVYCKNPWTLLNTRNPRVLRDGRFFLANRTVDSGKTDSCESGCWRVMGRDKLIKSEENEKIQILGFMKVFKFCEKEKSGFFKLVKRGSVGLYDDRIWLMEEYRLASKWKEDYVVCKIRLLCPRELKLLLCKHTGGIYRSS